MHSLLQPLDDLVNIFYPQICVACQTPLVDNEHLMCLNCLMELPKTGYEQYPENPVMKMFLGKVKLEKAASFLHFQKDGKVQNMMHQLKYKNRPEVGVFLGKLTGYELQTSNFIQDIDIIIPVPLHAQKFQKRGYNQAEQIGKGIAEATGLELNTRDLQRQTMSDSQTRKGRFDRWLNVETVFTLQNKVNLKGKHLLLIDDVVTTGSTLEGCILKLQAVKDVRISVYTLAKAQ